MTSTDYAPTAGMLSKVRALIDKAEATEFPAEADAYRAKADELMVKYMIGINDLLGSRTLAEGVQAPSPVPFDVVVGRNGPFIKYYSYMWGSIVAHVGLRNRGRWNYVSGDPTWMGEGVGFEADVQYAEMLYTAARMAFSERLEPKVNSELSDQENVYRLRSAGIERVRISDIMWGNTDKMFLARVGRLYKAECANRNEEPALSGRGVTGAAYREAYADHFVYELDQRLRRSRSGGNGLALGNRERVLNEAFYKRFPDMRPKAEVEGSEYVDPRANCEKCQKAKSGACREHPYGSSRGPKGRDPYSAASQRGAGAGAAAARTVDLGRTSGTKAVSN